jgi:hypothetical protein
MASYEYMISLLYKDKLHAVREGRPIDAPKKAPASASK